MMADTTEEKEVGGSKPKKNKHSCNVCGGVCTTRCSICRSVYYCSVKCQRQDWKAHKKTCSGKIQTKSKFGKVAASKIKFQPFENLPDEILVHIGKSVADFVGVTSFLRLSQMSKRFHRLLMDQSTLASVLDTCSKRIFTHTFDIEDNVPSVTNLQELKFLQDVEPANRDGDLRDNKIYFEQDAVATDRNHAHLLIEIILATLMRNPSALAIFDSHCGIEQPAEIADARSMINGKRICAKIQKNFAPILGEAKVESLLSRIRIRAWGAAVTTKDFLLKDRHGNQLRQGHGWVEVFFRMGDDGGLELPPSSSSYRDIPFPEEGNYRAIDMMYFMSNKPFAMNAHDYFTSCFHDFAPGVDLLDTMDDMLQELTTHGSSRMGPEIDRILSQMIRDGHATSQTEDLRDFGYDPHKAVLQYLMAAFPGAQPEPILAHFISKDYSRKGTCEHGHLLDELIRQIQERR